MLYIYFYLFTHVTESFVTERLVTESWGLLLAPPPYFSVSCLKRFPDTPRIYTMVLQGFISIVSLSPLLSNLHRRILRSAIIACALQKKSRITRSHTDSQQTSSPTYIGPRKQPGALGPTPLDISLTHHSRCHIRCLHTSLLEHHPTTLVPHPTGQSKVRPIRKSTTTHLKPVPQHGHKGLEEERILQPTRVHFTTTAGCLQRRVTTSKGTKSHSIEFTFTTHHSQPAGVHLQLVHTFRLPHGPKAQGPTSHSPDEVARDTCRTSADRGEPPKSLHTKPRFYRTPERMVGCHHTLPLQPFPLQESKLQISDTELTLVTHHGQQLPETRGLLMPKMP